MDLVIGVAMITLGIGLATGLALGLSMALYELEYEKKKENIRRKNKMIDVTKKYCNMLDKFNASLDLVKEMNVEGWDLNLEDFERDKELLNELQWKIRNHIIFIKELEEIKGE